MKAYLTIALALSTATAASAQVGYAPDRSPYRDLESTRELTFFSGYFDARKDPVGVAPQGGLMTGVRWDVRVGGPAYVVVRVAGASLERRIIDPTKPIAQRFVKNDKLPVLFTDVSLAFNLTGFKSWHGVVPYAAAGLGMTADLRGSNDIGKYRFGVPFTPTFGGGLKISTSRDWAIRLDWSSYLYRILYPDTYYIRTGADDPVRLPADPKSMWRRNTALQFGLIYLYHR